MKFINKHLILMVTMVFIVMVLSNNNLFSYISCNGSGSGYEGGNGGEGFTYTTTIETMIIEGAGYYLQANSDIQAILKMVELQDSKETDYQGLQRLVDSALENIANAYDMELNDLLTLNGISDQSVIYPGDKLLIQAGSTPVSEEVSPGSPTVEIEPTNIPSATATATSTNTPHTPLVVAMSIPIQRSATPLISPEPADSTNNDQGEVDYLLYAVFGLALTGTALILFGSALKRR